MSENPTDAAPETAQDTTDEQPLPRETGSEKAKASCPACGTELPVVETSYGSTVTGACPKCSSGDAETQVEAQKAAASEGRRKR